MGGGWGVLLPELEVDSVVSRWAEMKGCFSYLTRGIGYTKRMERHERSGLERIPDICLSNEPNHRFR